MANELPTADLSALQTGPRIREWGFWCPGDNAREPRWVQWEEFTATDNKGLVGRGCGE